MRPQIDSRWHRARAPHIHGELLKIGIDVGTTVAKHGKAGAAAIAGLEDVLHNHADGLRLDRPVCDPDYFLPIALWIADIAPRSPPNPAASNFTPVNCAGFPVISSLVPC